MLVLLDRDGVVNEDTPDYIKSPQEWRPVAGSLQAIARLNRGGHVVVVCTNQSGVGRKLFTEATLLRIHQRMHEALAAVGGHLDAVLHCPHTPEAGCDCRKPKPGMLLAARAQFPKAAAQCCFIGDTTRDVEAALAGSCVPILVRTGNGARDESEARRQGVKLIFDDLAAAVEWVLSCRV